MSSQPPAADVSVIIITRNTRALTSEAILSVANSRNSFTNEVIVVDNGSTDDTAAVLPQKFPAIKFIRSETNLGFARACNLAAKDARGEFLLLLNSDARLQPDALGTALEWMHTHPDCAVAGAQLLNPDGTRQNSIANFPTLATELLNKSLLRRLFPHRFPGKEQTFDKPVKIESVIGAFMLIRRKVWAALGGLDERFFFFFEETDFCLQATHQGFRVMHLPAVQVWHGQGQTAKQVSAAARIEYWRSRYIYFAKNHDAVTRKYLAAGLLVRLGINWIAAAIVTVITLGLAAPSREKWRISTALLKWHLLGQPAGMGLRPAADPPACGRGVILSQAQEN